MTGSLKVMIDNNFIHGHIGMQWCQEENCELIVIVEDNLVDDKVKQGLIDMAVVGDLKTRYYSVDELIRKYPKLSSKPYNILLIFRNLEDYLTCQLAGLKIDKLILTDLPFKQGFIHLTEEVSLSPSQLEFLKKMQMTGISVEVGNFNDHEPLLALT